jgi:hypothetical protein
MLHFAHRSVNSIHHKTFDAVLISHEMSKDRRRDIAVHLQRVGMIREIDGIQAKADLAGPFLSGEWQTDLEIPVDLYIE